MVSSINPSLFANSSPNLTTDGIASSAIRIIADTRARLGVSCSPLFIVACPIGVAATSQDLSKNKLANYKLKICILSTYLNSSQISLLNWEGSLSLTFWPKVRSTFCPVMCAQKVNKKNWNKVLINHCYYNQCGLSIDFQKCCKTVIVLLMSDSRLHIVTLLSF